MRNHKFDAVILGWGMPLDEPDDYQVWHSQADNKGSNVISFKHPRVDALLEENRRTFDPQKRIALYREFQQILNDEQPYTFLFIQKAIVALDKRFHNVTIYPGGLRPLEWWVPKALQRYQTSKLTQKEGWRHPMLPYLVQRLFLLIPTFIGVTFIAFFIIHLAPGDPPNCALVGLAPRARKDCRLRDAVL